MPYEPLHDGTGNIIFDGNGNPILVFYYAAPTSSGAALMTVARENRVMQVTSE